MGGHSVRRWGVAVVGVVVLAGLVGGGRVAASPPGVTSDLVPGQAGRVGATLERLGAVTDDEAKIATIEIPRVAVFGAILEGVDDVTIRRAVGHFPGTALPFEHGNMALAAHRTTHFAGLRGIKIGDTVLIHTERGDLTYRVETTWVVDPQETWVLDPTEEPSLTLVTCYPFDYAGQAPQRFVVRAREVHSGDTL